ncbi:glycosyltransferase [Aestuariibacter salexigens]|uniref:glycosyltransferase n=1 Tax=Aestuariibacter salexigens TaxID=226010 RepID=UPI0003FB6E91|nr:glycosyltransferase [Aestuariibacter salexigens]
MEIDSTILVLLAHYNGEEHIAEQLESLTKQENVKVSVLVSDDHSTAKSKSHLRKCGARFGEDKVKLASNTRKLRGHIHNFANLCDLARGLHYQYFAFSDQDDVWLPNKLSTLLTRMMELENMYGKSTPILVHCDLKVVDSQLNEVSPSFVSYQGLPDPANHDYPKFFYQNVVTGCATLFNRALLDIAAPIPDTAVVHDWWFAQCAKMTGVVDYVNHPLVLYRQHTNNSIGAKDYKVYRSYFKKYIYRALFDFPNHLSKSIEQAGALRKRLLCTTDSKSFENQALLTEFSQLKSLPLLERIKWAQIAIDSRGWMENLYFKFAFFIVRWIS